MFNQNQFGFRSKWGTMVKLIEEVIFHWNDQNIITQCKFIDLKKILTTSIIVFCWINGIHMDIGDLFLIY